MNRWQAATLVTAAPVPMQLVSLVTPRVAQDRQSCYGRKRPPGVRNVSVRNGLEYGETRSGATADKVRSSACSIVLSRLRMESEWKLDCGKPL